jgi:hypothetical protein
MPATLPMPLSSRRWDSFSVTKGYIDGMATMIAEMYDALRDAGASDEKARAAATAVAEHDTRLVKIEGDLNLVKWMIGFNVAMSVAILLKTFLI